MTRGRIAIAAVLAGATALLVGFQGASMLVTVTELGASPPGLSARPPKLPPRPPQTTAIVTPVPVEQKPAEAVPDSASVIVDAAGRPVVSDPPAGVAASMAVTEPPTDEDVQPVQERPRKRYRAPRPELHKVY